MSLDRAKLEVVLRNLGNALYQPTTLCIFGSAPAILLGQPSRQTQDVDVWHPKSSFDAGELARACESVGVLYDPKGELDPDAVYIQIVRPGIVTLPSDFETETVARYGLLTVVMPSPVALSAAKLARGNSKDVDDVVWWAMQRSISERQLAEQIARLPNAQHRETAHENLVYVRLIVGKS